MMLLLIDVGNSRFKFSLLTQSGDLWRAMGEAVACSHDRAEQLLRKLDEQYSVDRVLLSSVAGASVNALIENVFSDRLNVSRVTDQACGVSNDYESKQTLGVDRWLAAIGAATNPRYQDRNLIIVDAGTAITIDLVTKDKHYRGGVIMPGAAMMHASLVGGTAGVKASQKSSQSVIGRTTEQCVNAGIRYGIIGAVERVVCEIIKEVDAHQNCQILMLGGDSYWLHSLINVDVPIERNENLIFDGLLNSYESGELD